MLVGGCEDGAAKVSRSRSNTAKCDIRGVMLSVADDGKSALVGSRPGMLL
jgi:hypothetical protein